MRYWLVIGLFAILAAVARTGRSSLEASSVLWFSALDGSEIDADGVVDGRLALAELKLRGTDRLIVDHPHAVLSVASSVVLEEFASIVVQRDELGGAPELLIDCRGPVRLSESAEVSVSDGLRGGRIRIRAEGVISLGDSARITAPGVEDGGRIELCSQDNIVLSDETQLVATAESATSLGGRIVLCGRDLVLMGGERVALRASGASGGHVSLRARAAADSQVTVEGELDVHGAWNRGGVVDVSGGLGGVRLPLDSGSVALGGPTGQGSITVRTSGVFRGLRGLVEPVLVAPGHPIESNGCDCSSASELDTAPVANAGRDRGVQVGGEVHLDAQGSFDRDGGSLCYTWSFVEKPAGSRAELSDDGAVRSRFTVDREGEYTLALSVQDPEGHRSHDLVLVSTANVAPVADAGRDRTAGLGASTWLSGRGSTDLDGDRLSYSWDVVEAPRGSRARLSDADSVETRLRPDLPGDYVVRLVVRDGLHEAPPDLVRISTSSSAPHASAGADQQVLAGTSTTLDGSGSTDLDGDQLTYRWSLASAPRDSAAVLIDPKAVLAAIEIDVEGTYVVQLVVGDGSRDSKPDTVVLTTHGSTPVAHLGTDRVVSAPSTILLDGSGSVPSDVEPLHFAWSILSAPPGSVDPISLSSDPFVELVMDHAGDYVVQLSVNDPGSLGEPGTQVITTGNAAPLARPVLLAAGQVREPVLLDGSDSIDPNGSALTHFWSLLARPNGSRAVVEDPVAIATSFTPDRPGTYVAQLVVEDGERVSMPRTVLVRIENTVPVADLRILSGGELGVPVIADASNSWDADGDELSSHWTLVSRPAGSQAQLGSSTGSTVHFTPDQEGAYDLQLVVSDGSSSSPPYVDRIQASPAPKQHDIGSPTTLGLTLTLEAPTVAVGDSTLATVEIGKASGGDVVIALKSTKPNRASFATPSVTIPIGLKSAQAVVLGKSVGSATLKATSPAFASSNANVDVLPSSGFTVTAAPSSAIAIQGFSVSYAVSVNSTNGFSQLASLSAIGLPAGVTASFAPAQIANGQTSVLTVDVPPIQPLGTSSFSVMGSATIDGVPVGASTLLDLEVKPVTTSFLGRTVVDDALQTPLAGVTVTFLGQDGSGGPTGCSQSSVSDAAGNFVFTNLPPECSGRQLVRYDGTTCVSPPGVYAGVDLSYDIVPDQVTEPPVLVHLPRIDDAETVMVVQNAPVDQTFTFQTIPNLTVLVYAGTTFTLAGGGQPDPFPLTAIDVPVDRLPGATPPSSTALMPFIVAFQPANAAASEPVPVFFPTTLNAPPGTAVSLSTLDPTQGVMVTYGTGVISGDGRQIVPDLDPSNPGKLYGIVNFDWHGPVIPLALLSQALMNPGPPGGGACSIAKPIDPSSGIEIFTETDISIFGLRGSIEVQRTYRTLSGVAGPFGIGTNHNYGYRLDTAAPLGSAVINLIMPDGSAYPFADQGDGTLENASIPALLGVTMVVSANSEVDVRWMNGTVFHFVPSTVVNASDLDSIIDPNGNTVTLVRNPAQPTQILEIVDPVGRKLLLTYDGVDRITSITDPIGRSVSYTYNPQGTLETVDDLESEVTRYDYYLDNNLWKVTDARNIVVAENFYDVNGRVERQVQADGGEWLFDYVLMNPLVPTSPVMETTVTDPLGRPSTYRFNPQGFLESFTDTFGQMRVFEREQGSNLLIAARGSAACGSCGPVGGGDQSFTYDERGNLLTASDSLGNTTQFKYESKFGRLLTYTTPELETTSFTYDAAGNLLTVLDANQNTAHFTYDYHGLVMTVTDQLGNSTSFDYDFHGNLIAATDPLGNTSRQVYDAVSRSVEVIDALGRRSSMSYDNFNQLVDATSRLGNRIEWSYDEVGNLRFVTDPRMNTLEFTYDAMNRRESRIDGVYSDTRTYDFLGNVTEYLDRKGLSATFGYDSLDRVVTETYPDGSQVQRTYDARGLLVAVDDTEGGSFTFEFDSVGRPVSTTMAAGVVRYTYDNNGRVISTHIVGGPTVTYDHDPAGYLSSAASPDGGATFAYNARNLLQRIDRTSGVSTDYQYDPLARVTSIVHGNGGQVLGQLTYEYDAVGNRVEQTSDFAEPLQTSSATATYDPLSDRLIQWGSTTYVHDELGNRLSATDPEGTTTYKWDARSRLSSVAHTSGSTTQFKYDFAGNLIERHAQEPGVDMVEEFLLDDLTNVLAKTNDEGDQVFMLTGRTMDQTLGAFDQNGAVEFALGDALSSTVAATDENGIVTRKAAFEPFGETDSPEGILPSRFTARTQFGDLYYFRTRFYDPRVGRFVNQDPMGIAGGDLNLYRYVRNSPGQWVDPLGLDAIISAQVTEQLIQDAVSDLDESPLAFYALFGAFGKYDFKTLGSGIKFELCGVEGPISAGDFGNYIAAYAMSRVYRSSVGPIGLRDSVGPTVARAGGHASAVLEYSGILLNNAVLAAVPLVFRNVPIFEQQELPEHFFDSPQSKKFINLGIKAERRAPRW